MAVEMDPAIRSADLCVICHRQTVATQSGILEVDPTVTEHEDWRAKTGLQQACVDCHFPSTGDPYLVDGYARLMWGVERPHAPRRAHGGPGRAVALQQSVELEASWDGNVLVVRAQNTGASHALPGVSPTRAWRLNVHGKEAPLAGPRLENGDPGVWLRRVFSGARAETCVMPWEAEGVAEDTRLAPGAGVQWRWTYASVQAVEVSLVDISTCDERTGTSPAHRLLKRISLQLPHEKH
jgi:hypothetical protein